MQVDSQWRNRSGILIITKESPVFPIYFLPVPRASYGEPNAPDGPLSGAKLEDRQQKASLYGTESQYAQR